MHDKQPISQVQWVDADSLRANTWNPNVQTDEDKELLRRSLLRSGWTQPIVVTPDGEIVDGFHRWCLVIEDQEVNAMTDGQVPVVRARGDRCELMAATVRHNRARGTHGVLRMADIVIGMLDAGRTPQQVGESSGHGCGGGRAPGRPWRHGRARRRWRVQRSMGTGRWARGVNRYRAPSG